MDCGDFSLNLFRLNRQLCHRYGRLRLLTPNHNHCDKHKAYCNNKHNHKHSYSTPNLLDAMITSTYQIFDMIKPLLKIRLIFTGAQHWFCPHTKHEKSVSLTDLASETFRKRSIQLLANQQQRLMEIMFQRPSCLLITQPSCT